MGKTLTWPEPEGTPEQSMTQGSVQLVLDGRFALYLYQSSGGAEPQQGIFTFGFNILLDRYEASWLDSFHNNTAMMFCTGAALDDGFVLIGTYPDPIISFVFLNHNIPFVLGTSVPRILIAAPNAMPRALKIASAI